MKNISLVLLAFILTLSFTASDNVVEKGNKPDEAKKCPYLESTQQNHSQMHCPYLNRIEEGNSTCPFLNQNSGSQNGCPFLNGGSCNECPYLKQQGKEGIKEFETNLLFKDRNT